MKVDEYQGEPHPIHPEKGGAIHPRLERAGLPCLAAVRRGLLDQQAPNYGRDQSCE